VLRKLASARQTVKLVVADKGYDAERNHEYAWSLGARAVIPLRWGGTPGIWFKGQYRRKQLKNFDFEAYHRRAITETIHSIEKRKMGDIVLARGACQQHRELIFRAFAYNVGRMEFLFLSFVEGFYRAE
jgi:IS5 family transposase